MAFFCTKPVFDSDGGEFCGEPVLAGLDHTCYDHAKTCLHIACSEPREWDAIFCPEHMRYRG